MIITSSAVRRSRNRVSCSRSRPHVRDPRCRDGRPGSRAHSRSRPSEPDAHRQREGPPRTADHDPRYRPRREPLHAAHSLAPSGESPGCTAVARRCPAPVVVTARAPQNQSVWTLGWLDLVVLPTRRARRPKSASIRASADRLLGEEKQLSLARQRGAPTRPRRREARTTASRTSLPTRGRPYSAGGQRDDAPEEAVSVARGGGLSEDEAPAQQPGDGRLGLRYQMIQVQQPAQVQAPNRKLRPGCCVRRPPGAVGG